MSTTSRNRPHEGASPCAGFLVAISTRPPSPCRWLGGGCQDRWLAGSSMMPMPRQSLLSSELVTNPVVLARRLLVVTVAVADGILEIPRRRPRPKTPRESPRHAVSLTNIHLRPSRRTSPGPATGGPVSPPTGWLPQATSLAKLPEATEGTRAVNREHGRAASWSWRRSARSARCVESWPSARRRSRTPAPLRCSGTLFSMGHSASAIWLPVYRWTPPWVAVRSARSSRRALCSATSTPRTDGPARFRLPQRSGGPRRRSGSPHSALPASVGGLGRG